MGRGEVGLPRSTSFVGVLQVVTPTYLIFTANGDAYVILAAAGLYLFGFTYPYVGVNLAFDLDGTGLGYFCAFVVVSALVYSGLNIIRFQDNGFGVIWLYWAFLWALFFLVLGLKRDGLTRYTGAVCAIQGWVTGTIPAFLLLTGHYSENENIVAITLAVFGVIVFGLLYPRLRAETQVPPPQSTASGVPAGSSS